MSSWPHGNSSLSSTWWRTVSNSVQVSRGSKERTSSSNLGIQSVANLNGETRGVPCCEVLSRVGARLQNTEPSAQNFEVSVVTPVLNEFISHNWSLPRRDKFLILALRYNFFWAVGLLILAWILCATLTAGGWLPTVQHLFSDGTVRETGFCCTLLPVVFFLPAIFTAHDFLPRRWAKLVFLDKCCIHQVDLDRQRVAILNLAAFICRSEKFLTVYSEDYLRKLWTIYELACFLMMHGSANVTILPSFMPWFVIVGVSGWGTYNLLTYMFVRVLDAYGVVPGAATILSYVPLVVVAMWPLLARTWYRQLQSAAEQAKGFSIASATCTHDSDRAILEANIAQLVRERELVRPHDSHQTAMETFDCHVRDCFPRALRISLGPLAFQYRYAAAIGTSSIGYGLGVLSAQLRRGPLQRLHLVFLLERLMVGLAFVPLFTGSCMVTSRQFLHLRGLADRAYALLSAGLVLGTCYGLYKADNALLVPASDSVPLLAAKLGLEACMVVSTYGLYFCSFESGVPTRARRNSLGPVQKLSTADRDAPESFGSPVESEADSGEESVIQLTII